MYFSSNNYEKQASREIVCRIIHSFDFLHGKARQFIFPSKLVLVLNLNYSLIFLTCRISIQSIMPQFDKVTFFNQIFWLFFFFSGFYLTLLTTFLPKIGSALKARTKKLQKKSRNILSSLEAESFSIWDFVDYCLDRTCSACQASLLRGSHYLSVGVSSPAVRNFMEKALRQKTILFLVAKNFRVKKTNS